MRRSDTDALVPTEPFQLMLAADTLAPDWLQVAFQPWVSFWLASGKVKPSVQDEIGSPRLVKLTPAWNPPGHWLTTVYVAMHPVLAAEAGRVTAATTPPVATANPTTVAASMTLR